MFKKIIFFTTALLIVSCCFSANVFAAETKPALTDNAEYQMLVDDAKASLNPMDYTNPQSVLGIAVWGLISILGSLAMALYVYAGILFMTAAGNSEKTGKAVKIFLWTSLGVVVILGSYVIIDFVFKGILQFK